MIRIVNCKAHGRNSNGLVKGLIPAYDWRNWQAITHITPRIAVFHTEF
jgi:hypothetical protein